MSPLLLEPTWTPKAVMGAVAIGPVAAAFLVSLGIQRNDRTRPSSMLVLMWGSLTVASVMYLLQNLYPAYYLPISQLADFMVVWVGMSILVMVDMITRDALNTPKVAAYCVVATSAVFLTLIGPPGVGSLLVTVALFVVVLDW
ncbi:MAG: hypothetical protein ACTSU5_18220, partial [Promethearchaeota archaeon]